VETQCRQASEKLLIQEKKWQRNFAVEKRKFDQLTKHVELLKAEVNSLSQKLEEERKKGQQRKSARPVSSHPYTASEAPRNKDIKDKEEAMQANSRLKLQL
jgi:outer membrane murein-binding lipoprotein Lpp